MHAVVLTPRIADSVRVKEVPDLTPGPEQVLVRTLWVGLCGTDHELVEGLYGKAPLDSDFLVLGHESLGQVEAVGAGVTDLHPGDYVVATVRRPDDCTNCRAGEPDMCLTGNFTERGINGAHGFMVEYYVEWPQFLVRVPPELKDVGVLIEPLTIVEKAVRQTFAIQQRIVWKPKLAVVLGVGAVGLMAVALLRLRGLTTYALARRHDSPAIVPLQFMGTTYWCTEDHPLTRLPHELGNIDIIIEATGNTEVAYQCLEFLGTNGALALTGVFTGDRQISMGPRPLREMVLSNKVAFGTVNASRRDFTAGVDDMLAIEERWPSLLASLITRHAALADFRDGLERQPDDIKTVVEVGP